MHMLYYRQILFPPKNSALQYFVRCFGSSLQPITSVGFIGLGLMGNKMSKNILKQYKELHVFDVSQTAVAELEKEGAKPVSSLNELSNVSCIVSMLPSNRAVLDVYSGPHGLISKVRPGTTLVDSSTVDPQVPQRLAEEAAQRNITFLDAPVSGGVMAAEAGTLMFMVGGCPNATERCKNVLLTMGKDVLHCGPAGTGQVAKICNNMMLGISMVAASETLNLGSRLGLCPKLLSSIISRSTGRCWSIDSYNPVPGVMPETPSSKEYKGGFKSSLMLKDLGLVQEVAKRSGTPIPFGSNTFEIYKTLCDQQKGHLDFSVVYQYISELKSE